RCNTTVFYAANWLNNNGPGEYTLYFPYHGDEGHNPRAWPRLPGSSPGAWLLVQLVPGRKRKTGDGDALIDQGIVFGLGGDAADGTRGSLVVVDAAGFLGEVLADVLGLGEELVEHPGIEHLRDGERVPAFHVPRLGGR